MAVPAWAVRPNEPYGFRGRKAILNHAWPQLVGPNNKVNRHPRTLSKTSRDHWPVSVTPAYWPSTSAVFPADGSRSLAARRAAMWNVLALNVGGHRDVGTSRAAWKQCLSTRHGCSGSKRKDNNNNNNNNKMSVSLLPPPTLPPRQCSGGGVFSFLGGLVSPSVCMRGCALPHRLSSLSRRD